MLACGKLSLQLEFVGKDAARPTTDSEEPNPESAADSPSTQAGQTVPVQPISEFALNITIVEGNDLVQKGSKAPDVFACVSLMDDPGSMETRHFHALYHSTGQKAEGNILLEPQHHTKVVGSSVSPSWGDGCTLVEAHPSIRLVEQVRSSCS